MARQTMDPHARFGALDSLRGIAAMAVVAFHLSWLHITGDVLPHAYLAVDFFFALSGFVIAHAYQAKLAAGLSARAFVTRRLIRLYPMVVMALLLGAAVLLLKARVDPSHVDPPLHAIAGLASNLLLLPNPLGTEASQGVLFPGNGPLWSISLEVLINVVWCLWLTRLGTKGLAVWVALLFSLVVVFTLQRGNADLGFNWWTLPGGLARVGFGFGLGVLLYRLRHLVMNKREASMKAEAVTLLLGTLAMPIAGPMLTPLWDIVGIGLLVPLVMILGLNASDHPRLDDLLGTASYPLYAIHFPILTLLSGLHRARPDLGAGALVALAALTLAATTFAVIRFYDTPVRAWVAARYDGHRTRRLALAETATA